MTIRKTLFSLLAGGLTATMIGMAAVAQEKIEPADAQAASEGEPDRYSLVAVDGDILRVDRQNGTVSVCSERNDAWRCNPVPLAEDAYMAEIGELAEEVDRLTARLEEIESETEDTDRQLPPGSALDRPKKDEEGKSPLTSEEDEELDKVLTFTESAMRRFFGMVRDLQKDFDNEGN